MKSKLQATLFPMLFAAAFLMMLPTVATADSHAKLSPDELVLLSHLPDQQVGKKYPQGETINVGFLAALLEHPRFREARLSTNMIGEEYPDGFHPSDTVHDDPGDAG